MRLSSPSSCCLSLACLVCVLLTGCTLSTTAPSSPEVGAGAAITGRVMGGQQPLVGAHVYVLEANTTGYGGSGIAASSSNKSISLLTNVAGSTTLDTNGGPTNGDYYVTTGAGGAFSITGDYTCTLNSQVYLYSVGGDSGSGPNSAAGLLAAGNCPSGGSFPSSLYVVMNEVSTIATAYSMAGFATDALHIEFGDGEGDDGDFQCGRQCREPGESFDGGCADDDAGGEWNGAANHNQYAGKHSGELRELDRAGFDRVFDAVRRCEIGRFDRNGADRYGDGSN